MGDSSASCVLTGATLYTGAAVLIPLAPARFVGGSRNRPSFESGARVISNEGAAALFAPVLLPIFGKMDGYGGLTDIERRPEVEFVERRLGVEIDAIAEAAAHGGRIPKLARIARRYARRESTPGYRKQMSWNGSLRGCFVAREAWDYFTTHFWDDCGKPAFSVWDDGWLDPGVLTVLGFVCGEHDEARARALLGSDGTRYHTPWTHPKQPDVIAWCDQNMSSRFTLHNRALPDRIYKVRDLANALEAAGAPLPADAYARAQQTPLFYAKLRNEGREYWREYKRQRADRRAAEERPESTFQLIDDTTPAHILGPKIEAAREHAGAVITALLAQQRGEPVTDLPAPREPIPPHVGAVQTFCDHHVHVALTVGADGKGHDGVITKCDCTSAYPSTELLGAPQVSVSPEVIVLLRANGWKPRLPYRSYDTSLPYANMLAPEFLRVYRGRTYGAFMPAVGAVLQLEWNLHAANKLWQPTNSGYQYGNPRVQLEVAQLAVRLADAALTRRTKG